MTGKNKATAKFKCENPKTIQTNFLIAKFPSHDRGFSFPNEQQKKNHAISIVKGHTLKRRLRRNHFVQPCKCRNGLWLPSDQNMKTNVSRERIHDKNLKFCTHSNLIQLDDLL